MAIAYGDVDWTISIRFFHPAVVISTSSWYIVPVRAGTSISNLPLQPPSPSSNLLLPGAPSSYLQLQPSPSYLLFPSPTRGSLKLPIGPGRSISSSNLHPPAPTWGSPRLLPSPPVLRPPTSSSTLQPQFSVLQSRGDSDAFCEDSMGLRGFRSVPHDSAEFRRILMGFLCRSPSSAPP